MMARLLIGLSVGALFGLMLGYFGKCSTGTCPITRNYFTSVLYGAVIGLLFTGSLGSTPMDTAADAATKLSTPTPERAPALTDRDFSSTIEDSEIPVLVDVWAPWCGPCRMMAPVIDELSAEYAGKVHIYKLNAQENPETPQKLGVSGIPALLFLKDGEVVDRLVGLRDADELRAVLDRLLG